MFSVLYKCSTLFKNNSLDYFSVELNWLLAEAAESAWDSNCDQFLVEISKALELYNPAETTLDWGVFLTNCLNFFTQCLKAEEKNVTLFLEKISDSLLAHLRRKDALVLSTVASFQSSNVKDLRQLAFKLGMSYFLVYQQTLPTTKNKQNPLTYLNPSIGAW